MKIAAILLSATVILVPFTLWLGSYFKAEEDRSTRKIQQEIDQIHRDVEIKQSIKWKSPPTCKHCGQKARAGFKVCPHCGRDRW